MYSDDPGNSAPVPSTATLHTAAILDVWHRNANRMQQRSTRLRELAHLSSQGDLPEPERSEAERICHQLAGSLGMFGHPEACRAALALDGLLGTCPPLNLGLFLVLATQLCNLLDTALLSHS